MSEELQRALQELLAAADALVDELGYQGCGGQEARAYSAARARVIDLAPQLETEEVTP